MARSGLDPKKEGLGDIYLQSRDVPEEQEPGGRERGLTVKGETRKTSFRNRKQKLGVGEKK